LRESIPDGPEALESKCFLLKARNEELREENERLRREKRALKRQLANQRSLSDAERMVRAVARAHRRGKRWKTGADLKRWLQEWAEENAPEMPHSTSTIKRKLEEVGVWVSSGTSGHTGNAVQKTVQACLDRF
jgi:predicted RNase H-like nuclease (RuvC/YqgF family)